SDDIILDTQAPFGQFLSLTPSSYTTVTGITANLGATGATQVCLWGDMVGGSNDSCVANGWQAMNTNLSVTLSAGDNVKVINAKYRDGALWVSPTSTAQVTLDGTIPNTGTVQVNGGASVTGTISVNLTLSATDATSGIIDMALANESITCASA